MSAHPLRRLPVRWTLPTLTAWALSGVLAISTGCGPHKSTPEQAPAAGQTGQSPAGGAAQGADSKIEQALAKLSPEDRQSADAQKICPVSGEALGSMGTPIKFDVEGRTVWVCCAGCEQPVKDDPATYLAKIPAGNTPAGNAPAADSSAK